MTITGTRYRDIRLIKDGEVVQEALAGKEVVVGNIAAESGQTSMENSEKVTANNEHGQASDLASNPSQSH